MPRISRIVVPGVPHHVTQRGSRRQTTFFGSSDYQEYRQTLQHWCKETQVVIWAYCLMPNHVHLLLVPPTSESLGKAMRETHRRFSLLQNRRQGWKGQVWQGRYFSCPLSHTHLLLAARYIEGNPVRAGLARVAEAWPWSSARAHVTGIDDGVIAIEPLLSLYPDWRELLRSLPTREECRKVDLHSRTGRPLGDLSFSQVIENRFGVSLKYRKPGRPRKIGTGETLETPVGCGKENQ